MTVKYSLFLITQPYCDRTALKKYNQKHNGLKYKAGFYIHSKDKQWTAAGLTLISLVLFSIDKLHTHTRRKAESCTALFHFNISYLPAGSKRLPTTVQALVL